MRFEIVFIWKRSAFFCGTSNICTMLGGKIWGGEYNFGKKYTSEC